MNEINEMKMKFCLKNVSEHSFGRNEMTAIFFVLEPQNEFRNCWICLFEENYAIHHVMLQVDCSYVVVPLVLTRTARGAVKRSDVREGLALLMHLENR